MSRVGDALIQIPQGVQVVIEGSKVTSTGPKRQLVMNFLPEGIFEVVDNNVTVKRKKDDKFSRSAHGLTRALINNMVVGVANGWTKNLEMVGVGYRAVGGGDSVTLNVGFSHPVTYSTPEGIVFVVSENTKISVSGIDRALVGQVVADVRAVKPPEVYKGKGIRYAGEYVRRKAGKTAAGVKA